MKSISPRAKKSQDDGVTLVEVIISLAILSLMTVGIIQMIKLASRTISVDGTRALNSSVDSLMIRTFSADISRALGVIQASQSSASATATKMISNQCTSATVAQFTAGDIAPLITINVESQTVSAGTFYPYVGYELRKSETSTVSNLWRVGCTSLGSQSAKGPSIQVISGLPAVTDALWASTTSQVFTPISNVSGAPTKFPDNQYVAIGNTVASGLLTTTFGSSPTDLTVTRNYISLNDVANLRLGMLVKVDTTTVSATLPSVTTITSLVDKQITISESATTTTIPTDAKLIFTSIPGIQFSIPATVNSTARVITASRKLG